MKVYGVGIRKGGQGKSTTVSCLARLCALYGARVLVVDLAQPGTTSASLRDIWSPTEHTELANVMLAFRQVPQGAMPDARAVRKALDEALLPVHLESQPSWSGGRIMVLPWDDLQADAAFYLQSERILAGMIAALRGDTDIVLIDYPAESGPLLTNALYATESLIMPLVPEAPALEGVDAMLRLLARIRQAGHPIQLGGILMTRCEPKNKRVAEIAQTLRQADDVEGEPVSSKLLPFAIRQVEFYEQAFRYGGPIWERTANHSHWAGYVLLAEWLLRDAGLPDPTTSRRGPALLPPETRVLATSALLLPDPEISLSDFERTHTSTHS